VPPPSLSPTAPKQSVLRARVDTDIEQAFIAVAKQRGMKASDLLRSLILAEVGALGPPIGNVPAAPENASLEALNVRLPGFLMDAVKARSKMRGMPPGRWAASLIQSNLFRHPVLDSRETEALEATNLEFSAIGRNINQIARRLNETAHEANRVRLEDLAHLDQIIVKTRNVVRKLVSASRQAWKADEP
jgi:antitoxin component of RelBE/YafQ-DinJ toxin-antitoxin module